MTSTNFSKACVAAARVPIETAVSEACCGHQIGKTRPSNSILTECCRRRPDNALPSYSRDHVPASTLYRPSEPGGFMAMR